MLRQRYTRLKVQIFRTIYLVLANLHGLQEALIALRGWGMLEILKIPKQFTGLAELRAGTLLLHCGLQRLQHGTF